MVSVIEDVVLLAGARRLSAIDRSNHDVARVFQRFSLEAEMAVPGQPGVDLANQASDGVAPDIGQAMLQLTKNALSYSMVSRALSSQLGLYSQVISEGRGG